jgi:enamine deaminase RidA (YjgF/YER057c/UK114 family)
MMSCQDQTTPTNDQIPTIDYGAKLDSLVLDLQAPSAPVANYVNVVQTGNLLFLAGKGPKMKDGNYMTGTLGDDVTIEEGYQAARRVAELQIAVLQEYLGDLNKVKRVVQVLGLVRSTDDFGNQPEVMNGFSDTMVAVFGEKGKHARAAIGTNSLPRNICLEIEMIVEVY